MVVTHSVQGAETVVLLGGSVRIQEAEELAATLAEVLLAPTSGVTVDLGQVESVDLTCFQVLLALQRSLVRQKRRLLVRGLSTNRPLSDLATLTGLRLSQNFTLVETPS